MYIQELARRTGVSTKAIRYYESVGLLPAPRRAANNYRQYTDSAVDRLRFILSARSLSFSLAEIAEFLAARDQGTLPCQRVLKSIDRRLAEVDRRMAGLQALRQTLERIRRAGAELPEDQACHDRCVCNLMTDPAQSGPADRRRKEDERCGKKLAAP
jgi:DNA-binding transcriptional MerR regulator